MMDITSIRSRADIPVFLESNGLTNVIAEIGVREGKHLHSLLRCKPKKLVAVDIWRDDGIAAHNDRGEKQAQLDGFHLLVTNLARAFPCIEVIQQYSIAAAAIYKGAEIAFDFVYLDADHRYESVRDDIAAWWPLVRSGGMIGGHDYVAGKHGPKQIEFGVIPAVTEFSQREGLAVHTTGEQFASWFVRKP